MLQETESSAESVRSLLWLIVFVAANIFFIYYIFDDQKLYRRQVSCAVATTVYCSYLLICFTLFSFLSRISTAVLSRDVGVAVMSICLSVHLSCSVLYQNGLTYRLTFISILVFALAVPNIFAEFRWDPSMWYRIQMGYINFTISCQTGCLSCFATASAT